jgi:hypothetical protein
MGRVRLVPGATSAELALDQEALRRMVELQLRPYAEVAARTGLDRRTARKYIVDFNAASRS